MLAAGVQPTWGGANRKLLYVESGDEVLGEVVRAIAKWIGKELV